MKKQNQVPLAVFGPYERKGTTTHFSIYNPLIYENHKVYCTDSNCEIFLKNGEIKLTFPFSKILVKSFFWVRLYEFIDIEWKRVGEECINCLDLQGCFSLSINSNSVKFHSDCYNGYCEAHENEVTMTKTNAIRLLEEAIEFIRES